MKAGKERGEGRKESEVQEKRKGIEASKGRESEVQEKSKGIEASKGRQRSGESQGKGETGEEVKKDMRKEKKGGKKDRDGK